MVYVGSDNGTLITDIQEQSAQVFSKAKDSVDHFSVRDENKELMTECRQI